MSEGITPPKSSTSSSDLLRLESPLAIPFPKSFVVDERIKSALTAPEGDGPRTFRVEPRTSLKDRLKVFLPVMEAANRRLDEQIASGENVGIELRDEMETANGEVEKNGEAGKSVVEMTLGLFERHSDSESDDDDQDDDDEDSSEPKPPQKKIEEID